MRYLVLALITVVLAVTFIGCGSSHGRETEKAAASYYAAP